MEEKATDAPAVEETASLGPFDERDEVDREGERPADGQPRDVVLEESSDGAREQPRRVVDGATEADVEEQPERDVDGESKDVLEVQPKREVDEEPKDLPEVQPKREVDEEPKDLPEVQLKREVDEEPKDLPEVQPKRELAVEEEEEEEEESSDGMDEDSKEFEIEAGCRVDWFFIPDPVFLIIFQYLNPKELLTAGEVCRSWNRLSRDELLWKALVNRTYKVDSSVGIMPGERALFISFLSSFILGERSPQHTFSLPLCFNNTNKRLFLECQPQTVTFYAKTLFNLIKVCKLITYGTDFI
jgi:hypothetical protein